MEHNTTVFINILASLIDKYGGEILSEIEEDKKSSSIFLLICLLIYHYRVIIILIIFIDNGGRYYEKGICLYSR